MFMEFILLFNHYRTLDQRGGLRSSQIGSFLASNDHQVTAIVPGIDSLSEKRDPYLQGKFSTSSDIDGVSLIKVNSVKNSRRNKLSRILYYTSFSLTQFFIALGKTRAEVVFCNSLPLSQLFWAWIISVLQRSAFFVDVRDLPFDTAVEIGYLKKNIWTKTLETLETWLISRAQAIFCVSKGFKNILIAKGIREDKLYFAPIGYDKGLYEKSINFNKNIRQELGLNSQFLVLYAGTMGYVVDLMTVLRAAEEVKNRDDIVFVFAGAGQRKEEYEAFAKEKSLNIFFLGEVSKLKVIELSLAADVCAYGLQNGKVIGSLLGNKVFDHLGTKTPMLYCGPDGDIAWIVKNSGGGVCMPSGDWKSMAKWISYLASNREEVKKMAELGKDYIEKHYVTQQIMEQIETVIQNSKDSR